MSKLILTVFEPAVEPALAAIADAPELVDGFEVRLDAFSSPPASLAPFRNATPKELILTRRGQPLSVGEIEQALAAGFQFVDVEFSDRMDQAALDRFGERVILSHHDFTATPDLDRLSTRMNSFPVARRKIAAAPSSFADNERLLTLLTSSRDSHLTVIGLGAKGLYARILAPFFGSEMIFVARDGGSRAAPGQLTLEQAREIYGDHRLLPAPDALFAVVGNPVSHSRSPELHTRSFRDAKVAAAYSMIEVDLFEEVADAMAQRRPFAPVGVSITAPFKEDAYRLFANHAQLRERARRSRAVNTLVVSGRDLIADNTDVVGFAAGLARVPRHSSPAALLGAGGAARAALVALQDAGMRTTVYNRTYEKAVELAREFDATAEPLSSLRDFPGEVIVNALPASVEVDFPRPRGGLYLDVAYGHESEARLARARAAQMQVFDGLDFLEAQAVPQKALFLEVARERSQLQHAGVAQDR